MSLTVFVENVITRSDKGAFYRVRNGETNQYKTLHLHPFPSQDEVINGSVVRENVLNHVTNLFEFFISDKLTFSLSEPLDGTLEDLSNTIFDFYNNQQHPKPEGATESTNPPDVEDEDLLDDPRVYPYSLKIGDQLRVEYENNHGTNLITSHEYIVSSKNDEVNVVGAWKAETTRQDNYIVNRVCDSIEHYITFIESFSRSILKQLDSLQSKFHYIHNCVSPDTIGYRWVYQDENVIDIEFVLFNYSFIQRVDLPFNLYQNIVHFETVGPEFMEHYFHKDDDGQIMINTKTKDVWSLGTIVLGFLTLKSQIVVDDDVVDNENNVALPVEGQQPKKTQQKSSKKSSKRRNDDEDSDSEYQDEDECEEVTSGDSEEDLESEVDEDAESLGDEDTDVDDDEDDEDNEQDENDEDDDEEGDIIDSDEEAIEDKRSIYIEDDNPLNVRDADHVSRWKHVGIPLTHIEDIIEQYKELQLHTMEHPKITPTNLVEITNGITEEPLLPFASANPIFFQFVLSMLIDDPMNRPEPFQLLEQQDQQEVVSSQESIAALGATVSIEELNWIYECYSKGWFDLHPIIAYPFILTTLQTYHQLMLQYPVDMNTADTETSQKSLFLLASCYTEAFFIDSFFLPVVSESIFNMFRVKLDLKKLTARQIQLKGQAIYWSLLTKFQPVIPLGYTRDFVENELKTNKDEWVFQIDQGVFGEEIGKKQTRQIQHMFHVLKRDFLMNEPNVNRWKLCCLRPQEEDEQ